MPTKEQILKGREAVDKYRADHAALYLINPHRKGIPSNLEEAGLIGKPKLTPEDRKMLDRMWH